MRWSSVLAIPESQLSTWSNVGATATPARVYERVRNILIDSDALQGVEKEIFLQGSYRNKTNVYADSDVDIVVCLQGSWREDLTFMPPEQRAAYERSVITLPYGESQFKDDVFRALLDGCPTGTVQVGSKVFTVTMEGMTADVLACVEHRKYVSFVSHDSHLKVVGIAFTDRAGNFIVNYPKQHIENGQRKNQATGERYKPSVRMIKNARNVLIERGRLSARTAPSFFIECLMHNMANDSFSGSCALTYLNVVTCLVDRDHAGMKCQNGLIPLFGSSAVQWNVAEAKTFLDELWWLWENF